MLPLGVLFAVGTMVAWSVVPFFMRAALQTLDPVTLAASRMLLGGLTFSALALSEKAKPWGFWREPTLLVWVLVGGAALGVNQTLYAAALQWTTPTAASIAVQVQTIAASLFGWILLGESISAKKGVGMFVVIAAIVVMNLDADTLGTLFSSGYFKGNMTAATAGIIWGVYGVAQRRLSRDMAGSALLAPMFLTAALVGLPVSALTMELRQPLTAGFFASLLGLVLVGTVIGYLSLDQALKRLPVATALTITNLSPLAVAAISLVAFGERVNWLTLLSGMLAVGGCTLAVSADRRASPAAVAGPPSL